MTKNEGWEKKLSSDPNGGILHIWIEGAGGWFPADEKMIKTFIRQEFAQARLKEREDCLKEIINKINKIKNTSEGTTDWYNGLRCGRGVAEFLLAFKKSERKVE